ncbi:MAG: trigger factor, partial [Chloroflexota bacterium]
QQWEKAKKDAAKEVSKQIRVKGFRKGKAPYNVVVRTVGEGVIIEEAMETLGNDVYREVIQSTELEPYASGSLEDFQLEPQPTYTFTVPLVPEIELGDYREVRLDFEAPVISDEDVDRAMRQYQQQEAVVEDSANPVQSGDRVTIDINSEFADGEEPSDDDEDDSDDETPKKGDPFIHQHDATINLDPENEPVLPGFIEALVGANVEDTVEFELTVPEGDEDYREGVRGRKVSFEVTISDIKNVTLPELNDDLAARITEDEADEPLTLLELRVRTREELQEQANRNADSAYSDQVLDKIAEGATLSYPEIMLTERIHDMIDDLDRNLQQQGMNLETYQQVMGITHDDLHEQYEEDAVKSLERSLVLGEVLVQEGINVTADDVADEINKTLAQFGEQADMFRQFFDTEQQRANIANNILYERIMTRLAKIGKGEPLDEPDEENQEDSEEPVEQEVADEPQATVEDTPSDADNASEEDEEVVSKATADDNTANDD